MARLIRMNEVQYADTDVRIEKLLSEGFKIEELHAPQHHPPDEAIEVETTEEDPAEVHHDDYKGLKKHELLALALEKGLDVTEDNTVAEIKSALMFHE